MTQKKVYVRMGYFDEETQRLVTVFKSVSYTMCECYARLLCKYRPDLDVFIQRVGVGRYGSY